MKWIKHDTDANQDAKLQNLLLDYGLEGYGLYWYCIELIAGKVDVNNITFELEHDARIIARNTGSTAQRVEEMMKYFVKIGLFECSNNTITCLKLAKRLDQSMTSNPVMREIIKNFKEVQSHDSVMINHDDVMQDKIRLDQIREDNKNTIKRERKSKSPDFFHPEELNLDAWKEWIDYRKASNLRAYQMNAKSAGAVMSKLVNMSNGDKDVQMLIVKQSIENAYQGLFPVRATPKPKQNRHQLRDIVHTSGSF